MKAFLSHATADKQFVGLVAKYLGREYIVYDAYSFDHGEEFKSEIVRGLGKSNIFVFFVSRASLKSFWVDLELDEARRKLFDHDISKAICIRLDNSITFDELPHWLQRINAPFIGAPGIAASLVKDHINKLKRETSPDLFVGRTPDIAKIEQVLTPPDHRPPGIVALWGLPGIGRRTVAKRVLRDILDFQRPLSVNIEIGDGIADLRLKLAAYLDTPKNSDAYPELQRVVEAASPEQNNIACLELIERVQSGRELVLLTDQGGLLNEDGELQPDFRSLILAIFATQTLRCIIISRRRPAALELEPGLALPNVRIDRLSEEATRTLLKQLGAREQLTLVPQEVEALADKVKGYPPAAFHATGLIKDYGKELILRDAREIINFRETSFLRLRENENKFTSTQRQILGLLPNFDALPLPVLGEATDADQETVDRDAMRLVDLALLNIDENGFYAISDPVREVTYKVFGHLDIPYDKIASAIDRYLDARQADGAEEGIPLNLVRARYKAYVLSGRSRSKLFHMASDLLRLQETLYHDQEYDKSIEMGTQALEIRKDHLDALKYIARAQTQLEHYPDAQKTIDRIKKQSVKEAKFLEGFLMRKSGRVVPAITAYSDALALGMKGVAIHRELGQCLFLNGQFAEAKQHLSTARNADPTNKFVLDYDIKVAIAEERFDDAQKSIPQFAQVEEESRVQHRISTLESAMGNFEAAFVAAERAVKGTRRPQFEVITQYVTSSIRTKRIPDAREGLTMLTQRFQHIRKDIQNGLWARFYLAQGDVDQASAFWNKIVNVRSQIHQRIREDIIDFILRNHALPPDQRAKLKAELDQIRHSPRKSGLEALETELI